MATTLLGVLPGSRLGEWSAGDLVVTTYRRTFLVQSDAPKTDDEQTVLNTAGLPRLNELYTGESGTSSAAICKNLRAVDVVRERTKWLVEAEFSNDTDSTEDNQDSGESGEDPTDLDPDFEFGVRKEIYVPRTVSENASEQITNAAGEPFTDPPVTATRIIPWWRMSRWRLTFDVLSLEAVNCTNNQTWRGVPPNHALVVDIASGTQQLFGQKLWRVRYLVEFRPFLNPKPSKVPTVAGTFRTGWWFPEGGKEGWCTRLDNLGTKYWPNGYLTGESRLFAAEPPHAKLGWLDALGNKTFEAGSFPIYVDRHNRIDMEALIFGADDAPNPTPAVSDPAPT